MHISLPAQTRSVMRLRVNWKSARKYATYNSTSEYLAHVIKNNISTDSTLFRGTYFELHTKSVLENYLKINSQNIHLTGGSYDQGVDMIAKWDVRQYFSGEEVKLSDKLVVSKGWLDVNLIVQCKISKRKIPSKVLREMTGIYNDKVSIKNKNRSFLTFATNSSLSEDGLTYFNRCETPMLLLQIELPTLVRKRNKLSFRGGLLQLYLRNEKARKLLEGLNDYETINEKIILQSIQ